MTEDAIARYSFLPWLKQGIGGKIQEVDDLGGGTTGQEERATIDVSLTINDDQDNPVVKPIKLIGPGDITSIDSRAIIRTDPLKWVTDFEPNYLGTIEFYDEDFPWRYTPAVATNDHRLRPWIFLIVLKEDEFSRIPSPEDSLPIIEIDSAASLLPDPGQIWAWAHVHVNKELTPNEGDGIDQALTNLTEVQKDNTDLAISRLICPRKLERNTAYFVFLIPSFETGRLAGIGQPIPGNIDGLKPSWGDANQTQFPVYYEFYFRTGSRGDFEYLVRLLEPRVLDKRVGIRDMDVQKPAPDFTPIINPPALGLEGALKTTETKSTEWPDPSQFHQEISDLINLAEDLKDQNDGNQDPIVTPPLYGRWHAVVKRLREPNNSHWIDELNLDPRHRTVGGFGTRVIQENQEELMNEAWEQVGRIAEANSQLRLAQFAREASISLWTKNFTNTETERLLSLTAPVFPRVLAGTSTIHQQVKESIISLAPASPAFRRVTRSRGPILRRTNPLGSPRSNNFISRINKGEIRAAPPKQASKNQLLLEDISDTLFPKWVPNWLKPILKWAKWIVLGVLIIFIVVIIVPLYLEESAPSSLVTNWQTIVIALLFALFLILFRLGRTAEISYALREDGLTPELVSSARQNPDFEITKPGTQATEQQRRGSDSTEAANFRQAAKELHQQFQLEIPQPAALTPINITETQSILLQSLDPSKTIPNRQLSFLGITNIRISMYLPTRSDPLATVMAHPDFSRPMYEYLRDISSELLIPNLHLIPQNTISLLETNQPFIESYMVGLNHEMARELLWREYPTDQRGSYFRQFWDVSEYGNTDPSLSDKDLAEKLRDIKPIHKWPRSAYLGDNDNRQTSKDDENLVLVIRGDLLKKYPTAVVVAIKASWKREEEVGVTTWKRELSDEELDPAFKAKIDPDLTFFGFELTANEAKGSSNPDDKKPGWFFAIKQRPGEPRFGLDVTEGPATEEFREWNDLTWGHLTANQAELDTLTFIDLSKPLQHENIDPNKNPDDVHWNTQSSDMAHILYQVPVLIAVHAEEMLP